MPRGNEGSPISHLILPSSAHSSETHGFCSPDDSFSHERKSPSISQTKSSRIRTFSFSFLCEIPVPKQQQQQQQHQDFREVEERSLFLLSFLPKEERKRRRGVEGRAFRGHRSSRPRRRGLARREGPSRSGSILLLSFLPSFPWIFCETTNSRKLVDFYKKSLIFSNNLKKAHGLIVYSR